jgi:hypothetical protein
MLHDHSYGVPQSPLFQVMTLGAAIGQDSYGLHKPPRPRKLPPDFFQDNRCLMIFAQPPSKHLLSSHPYFLQTLPILVSHSAALLYARLQSRPWPPQARLAATHISLPPTFAFDESLVP